MDADPVGVSFPWAPLALDRLNGMTAGIINDAPLVLLLAGAGWAEERLKARAEELLLKVRGVPDGRAAATCLRSRFRARSRSRLRPRSRSR